MLPMTQLQSTAGMHLPLDQCPIITMSVFRYEAAASVIAAAAIALAL